MLVYSFNMIELASSVLLLHLRYPPDHTIRSDPRISVHSVHLRRMAKYEKMDEYASFIITLDALLLCALNIRMALYNNAHSPLLFFSQSVLSQASMQQLNVFCSPAQCVSPRLLFASVAQQQ